MNLETTFFNISWSAIELNPGIQYEFAWNFITEILPRTIKSNVYYCSFFIVFCIIMLFIVCFLAILLYTAAFTLVERKVMGLLQRREGPDKVGFEGIGQPIADGVKLIKKETLTPKDSPSQTVFVFAPVISLAISLVLWGMIPFSKFSGGFVNSEITIILFLATSSIGSYGVIYAGWASNNKYALMGAFRSVAQLISYEIIFSLLFMPVMVMSKSSNFYQIIISQEKNGWFACYLFPFILIYFIVALAETNRTPFDLPEAEAELVSGFNVEYSSLTFAAFFLAEYSSMGVISAIFVIFFAGGWNTSIFGTNYDTIYFDKLNFYDFFFYNVNFYCFFNILVMAVKITISSFFFVFIRAALPRKRFDQLVQLCWKVLFPITFSIVIFSISLIVTFFNFFSALDAENWIIFVLY